MFTDVKINKPEANNNSNNQLVRKMSMATKNFLSKENQERIERINKKKREDELFKILAKSEKEIKECQLDIMARANLNREPEAEDFKNREKELISIGF